MKPYVVLALALFLSACVTTPVPSASAKPVPAEQILAPKFLAPDDAKGRLLVTRDEGFRGSGARMRFYADGVAIADLWSGEQLAVYLEEGNHNIGIVAMVGNLTGNSADAVIDIKPRETLRYRITSQQFRPLALKPSPY